LPSFDDHLPSFDDHLPAFDDHLPSFDDHLPSLFDQNQHFSMKLLNLDEKSSSYDNIQLSKNKCKSRTENIKSFLNTRNYSPVTIQFKLKPR
jgi:hypothetical protein